MFGKSTDPATPKPMRRKPASKSGHALICNVLPPEDSEARKTQPMRTKKTSNDSAAAKARPTRKKGANVEPPEKGTLL